MSASAVMEPPKVPGDKIKHVSVIIGKPKNPRAAQVHVWRNDVMLFGVVPDAKHPGHAAMQLYENGEVMRYVSWWPDDKIGKEEKSHLVGGHGGNRISIDAMSELGKSAKAILQEARDQAKFDHDVKVPARPGQYLHSQGDLESYNSKLAVERRRWMQLPEISVSLPAMGAPNVRWGLYLPGIADWWDNWSAHSKYVMKSTTNNCSGAVAAALRAGGAECFVAAPIAIVCLAPRAIADWAQKLEDRLRTLDLHFNRLQHIVKRAQAELVKCPLPGPLPKKDAWLKASALNLKPRSSELRAIDNALGEYLQSTSTADFDIDRHKRLVLLVEAIYTHAMARRTSERRNWVLSLAELAMNVVEDANRRVPAIL